MNSDLRVLTDSRLDVLFDGLEEVVELGIRTGAEALQAVTSESILLVSATIFNNISVMVIHVTNGFRYIVLELVEPRILDCQTVILNADGGSWINFTQQLVEHDWTIVVHVSIGINEGEFVLGELKIGKCSRS